jgi:hypothetical protein
MDDDIGFDWANDAPAAGLPTEEFSVRWTRVATFEQGLYRFHAAMDDGMRVFVGEELLIDEWHSAWNQTHEIEVDLSSRPKLVIEMFEEADDARVNVS